MNDDDLTHADLSHLRIAQMTTAQKAEMQRRYSEFVRRLAKAPAVAARRPASVTKWQPGRRIT